MALFAGLFSSKSPEKPSGKEEILVLMGAGRFEVEITGNERDQAALEAICGRRVPRGVNRSETAWLILVNKNAHEKTAVHVVIRGKKVGSLRPEAAILYRQALTAKGKPKATVQCPALIKGGWVSSDGRKGRYEVWLDLPTWS